MEGSHEQKIATKGRVLRLTLLEHIAHGETRIVGTIRRELTATLNSEVESLRALSYQGRNELGDFLDHAKQAALDVFKVVPQELVDVLVQVELDCDDEPDRVHLKEKQIGEKGLASDHNLRILDQLRKCSMENCLLLQCLVKFLIWLGQGDV